MKSLLVPAAIIAAMGVGGLYARWQVTEDCLYLGGFKAYGKVYVCEGMTENVKKEIVVEKGIKEPL